MFRIRSSDCRQALLTIDETDTIRDKWSTEPAYESTSFDELDQTVLSLDKERS